jgi:hypothetical protein
LAGKSHIEIITNFNCLIPAALIMEKILFEVNNSGFEMKKVDKFRLALNF